MPVNNNQVIPIPLKISKELAEEVALHISNRRTRLRKQFYSLAQIIYSLDIKPMDEETVKNISMPTAYTDGLEIRYNPAFMATMPNDEDILKDGLTFVLMHEVMHKVLFHCSSIRVNRKYRNMEVFNLACDYAVNAMLKNLGFSIPKGNGFLYREDLADLATEEIYRILMGEFIEKAKQIKQQQQQQQGSQGQGCGGNGGGITIELPEDGSGSNSSNQNSGNPSEGGGVVDVSSNPKRGRGRPKKDQTGGQGNQKDQAGNGKGEQQGDGGESGSIVPKGMKSFDDHSHWGDRIPSDEEKAKEEERKEKQMANATLGRLANEIKDRYQGKLPGFMKRIMDEGAKNEYSFADAINRFVVNCIAPQQTTLRVPNYNLLSFGYFPGMEKRYLDMTIAVDTSGSIGNDELKKFYDAISSTLKEFASWHVDLLFCDAKIHNKLSIDNKEGLSEAFAKKIGGGGGTDFRPVFEAVEKTAILVYLTDGYGEFPKQEPCYPVIWVSLTDEKEVKYPDWYNSEVIPLEKLKSSA
jgi:predicted metal-dependent peptidase